MSTNAPQHAGASTEHSTEAPVSPVVAPGYLPSQRALLTRLRRIEGQVRGLQRMVEEERYCINILEQVAAATRALQGVALALLDDHLQHCMAGQSGEDAEDRAAHVEEASAAIARLVRS